MPCGAGDLSDGTVHGLEKLLAVRRLDQPGGAGAVDQPLCLFGSEPKGRGDIVGAEFGAQR